MCLTHFRPNNIYQSIVFSADYSKYSNQPKGMREVLKERNLWWDGLIEDCRLCKGKNKIIDN